jgi:DNA-binding IclR family transcriptional regulator
MSDTLGTVARALSVLTVIAEAKASVGVKDVADALKLPMSTSHRLLDLLLEAGFVEKNAARRRYAIGLEFFRLANLVVQKASYATLVQPILDQLAAETGETVIYSTYLAAQRAMMYAAKSDSPSSLRFRITLFQQMPLEWGSSGLAILALLPPEVQAEVFAHTQPSPISRKRLTRTAFYTRIASTRRDGFAFTQSEKLPDSIGIAAPVIMEQNNVVGSITLTVPKIRFSRAKLKTYAELVKKEVARFSSRSGLTGTPASQRSQN